VTLTKRLLMGLVAAAVPVGLVATIGVGAAVAGAPPPVTGTGTVSCTGAAGKVSFSPPLTGAGPTSPDTATIAVTLKGCTASAGSNVTSASFTGKVAGSITTPSQNCTGLVGTNNVSGTLSVAWTGKAGKAKLNPSSLSLTQIKGLASGTLNPNNPGFQFGTQYGLTADPVTASFAASSANGEIDAGVSTAKLTATCTKATGKIATLPIKYGTGTL